MGKAPSDQFASASVILRRRLFIGDTVQIHAEFAHGSELVFHLPARQSDAHLAIGEKVRRCIGLANVNAFSRRYGSRGSNGLNRLPFWHPQERWATASASARSNGECH